MECFEQSTKDEITELYNLIDDLNKKVDSLNDVVEELQSELWKLEEIQG